MSASNKRILFLAMMVSCIQSNCQQSLSTRLWHQFVIPGILQCSVFKRLFL